MSFLALFRPLRPDRAELREVTDRLPLAVRIAMLEGVRAERIIAGAYTDGRGGVCPMLAAHRHGARWSYPDFARTWDEFAEAPVEGLRTASPAHVETLADVLAESVRDELRTDPSIPDALDARSVAPALARRPTIPTATDAPADASDRSGAPGAAATQADRPAAVTP